MRNLYMLFKLSLVFLLCLVNIDVQGQSVKIEPFSMEWQIFEMDARHINWSDLEGIQPNRAAITRGDGPGLKWIDRIGNMPSYMHDFYQVYGEKVKEVMNGGANWLSDPTMGQVNSSGDYYTTIKTLTGSVDFTFPPGASEDVITAAYQKAWNDEYNKITNEFECFIRYLVLCLNYDFPEAFWTGNSAQWGWGAGIGGGYDPSAGSGTITYSMPLTFVLKTTSFDYRIEGLRTQQSISDAVTEFNSKVKSVTDPFVGKSRYDQIVGLNEWLTMHNSYNSDLIANNPTDEIAWSPLSALRESTGPLGPVCEGYARAMKCLCDKLSIPCILAVGNAKSYKGGAGESHMWNEVQMDNNKWYAVDVTWNDPTGGPASNQKVSGFENKFWFLLGNKDEIDTDFTFAESHPNTPVENGVIESQWNILFASLIEDYHYQPAVPITITVAKQSTYCSDKNLDFSSWPDLKAYVATGYDKTTGTIWLTRVKDVPANTGFLLMGDPNTYDIPFKDGVSDSYYVNLFKGTLTSMKLQATDGANTNYYLSNGSYGVGFYKPSSDGVDLGANRAYLSVPTDIQPVGTAGGTETINVSSALQMTYCSNNSLDFTEWDQVKAYTATGYNYNSGTIWLTRVKKVPAGTGILIMAPEGSYPITKASVASVYANMFIGTLEGKTIQTEEKIGDVDYINYYLSAGTYGVGFYKVTQAGGVSLSTNRSYLPIPKRTVAGTRGISSDTERYGIRESDDVISIRLFNGEDAQQGFELIENAASKMEKDVFYNLQGQRVNNPGKGLYIKNGKKVVVR